MQVSSIPTQSALRLLKKSVTIVKCHAELVSASNKSMHYETLKRACPGDRPGFRVTKEDFFSTLHFGY